MLLLLMNCFWRCQDGAACLWGGGRSQWQVTLRANRRGRASQKEIKVFSHQPTIQSRPCVGCVVWEGFGCTVLCVLPHLHSAKSIRGRNRFSILFVFLLLRLFAFLPFCLFAFLPFCLFASLPLCLFASSLFCLSAFSSFPQNKSERIWGKQKRQAIGLVFRLKRS